MSAKQITPLYARVSQQEKTFIQKKCKEKDETVSQRIRKLLRLWIQYEEKMFDENNYK